MGSRNKRAAFGDESSWSDSTHIEVEKHIRSFKAVCEREGQNHAAPDERWLAKHIQDIRERSGRSYATRHARCVGHHLRRVGAPALTDGTLVRAVLRAPDGLDPLAMDLDPSDLPFSLGRAQMFSDAAFHSATYRSYGRAARKWVARCNVSGIDPIRPPFEELQQYFEDLCQVKAAGTVSNHRSALSYYFRNNKAPDLARTPEIERILDGVKRAKPRRRLHPTTAAVRHAMLSSFEDVGAGVRDRVIVLLTAFTPMGCDRIALLTAEQCRFVDDGVEIVSLGTGRPVFVGSHPDRDLDITYWLGRLLEMVPSGLLFRSVVPRELRFGEVGLTSTSVNRVVAHAAQRAGEPPDDMADRLRLLFQAETHLHASPVILAYQNSLKNVPNDGSETRRRHKLKSRGIGRSISAQAALS
jgi:integrase